MELLAKINIKIPLRASSLLVSKLRKRGNYVTTGKAYATNQATRTFGFFFACKAITTSGTIFDYPKQMQQIYAVTGLNSYSSVLERLRKCERFGLLKVDWKAKSIQLCSWVECMKILDIPLKKEEIKFVNYEFENKTPVPCQYLIELAEETEQQHFTRAGAIRAINQNKELVKMLLPKIEPSQHPVDALFEWQKNSFINADLSAVDYKLLHSVQSCPYRSVKAMINTRKNGKHIRATFERIAYLKRKISLPELCSISNQVFASNGKCRPNSEYYYNGYDKVINKPIWYLPDALKPLAHVG
ncbi:MAG: hypothetical protein V4538_02470 [Bacteroidota bacterium]